MAVDGSREGMPMARRADSLAERASKGGRARAASLTPGERSASARRAVRARWAKARAGGATITATAGIVQRGPTASVEISGWFHDGPLVTMDVGSRSVNARSSVVTLKKPGGSFTQ
jgi:hypothetical protein